MNDQEKIRALMIYYEHWGRYEIQQHKLVYGMDQTINLLKKDQSIQEFQEELEDISNFFKKKNNLNQKILNNIYAEIIRDYASKLLHNLGGIVPFHVEEPNRFFGSVKFRTDLYNKRKTRLRSHLPTTCKIGLLSLNTKQILSIESIVALY